jgi:hypothetical protein
VLAALISTASGGYLKPQAEFAVAKVTEVSGVEEFHGAGIFAPDGCSACKTKGSCCNDCRGRAIAIAIRGAAASG